MKIRSATPTPHQPRRPRGPRCESRLLPRAATTPVPTRAKRVGGRYSNGCATCSTRVVCTPISRKPWDRLPKYPATSVIPMNTRGLRVRPGVATVRGRRRIRPRIMRGRPERSHRTRRAFLYERSNWSSTCPLRYLVSAVSMSAPAEPQGTDSGDHGNRHPQCLEEKCRERIEAELRSNHVHQ